MFLTITSFFNTFGLVFGTIAMQNEKSGFITSIGYITIVYAFLGDIWIFNSSFSTSEVIGITLILTVIGFLIFRTFIGIK